LVAGWRRQKLFDKNNRMASATCPIQVEFNEYHSVKGFSVALQQPMEVVMHALISNPNSSRKAR